MAKLTTSILKILFKFLLIHILLIFIWFISIKDSKNQFDTCYDEGLSLSQQAGISAYFEKTENYKFNDSDLPSDAEMNTYFSGISTKKPSESENQWIQNYGQDQFSQFLTAEDKKMGNTTFTLNGQPIRIKIRGKWSPWFGELNESNRKALLQGTVKQQFYCSLEKKTLSNTNKFSQYTDKEDENTFYYIENYNDFYGIYTDNDKNRKNIVMRVKDAEYQEPCWVTRGAGLYLGVFGLTGKTTPTEYYHLIAQKMECPIKSWFNGKKMVDRTAITNNYTYSDFKQNYFSLEYYLDQRNRKLSNDGKVSQLSAEDREKARKILTNVENTKMVFDIDLLETLLIKYGVQNVGYIISNAMSRFNYACYTEEKSASGGMQRNTDNAYFVYGPKEIRRHFSTYTEKFKYGEEVRFFILDRNYNDNIGQYNIDILSGLEYDTKGSITSKLQDLEFTLLGTPRPNQKSDRNDGFVAKIFSNIIQSNYIKILRACLVLAVMFFGFRTIMGYGWNNKAVKYSEHFRKLFVYKEFMTVCLRMCIALALTTETGFQLFNKTFINFVVNGTIGLIDLIATFYGQSLIQQNNLFFLTGGLERANSVLSLSRNFAILDEIFAMLTDKVIIYKILSLYFTKDFFFSIIGVVLMAYIIFKYIIVLIKSVVPFAFILLQWTVALPLAPFMLLFGLFKRTEEKLVNWINFCVSKSFELVAFFISFYFWTGIINNQIQQLLNFKVCIRRLTKFLFGGINGVDTANTIIGATTAIAILSVLVGAGCGLSAGLVTSIVFIVVTIIFYACAATIPYYEKQSTTESANIVILGIGNSSFYKQFLNLKNGTGFVIECLLTIIMIVMFDTITKGIMEIAGGIFVYNKAKADTKGGALANTSNFSVDNQFGQFGDDTGLANLQSNVDDLHWTRTFMNFKDKDGNRGKLSDNILNTAKLAGDNKFTRGLFGGLESKIAGTAKDGDKELTLKEAITKQIDEENASELTQGAVGLVKGAASTFDNVFAGGRIGQKINDNSAAEFDKNLVSANGYNMDTQTNIDKVSRFKKSADLHKVNLSRELMTTDNFIHSRSRDENITFTTANGTRNLVQEMNAMFKELGEIKTKHGGFFGRRHNNITRSDLAFINEKLEELGISKYNGKEFNEYDLYNLNKYGIEYLLKEFNVKGASSGIDYINRKYYTDKNGKYNIDSKGLFIRSAKDPHTLVRAINDKGQMLFLDKEGTQPVTLREVEGKLTAYDNNGAEVTSVFDAGGNPVELFNSGNTTSFLDSNGDPVNVFDTGGNTIDLIDMAKDIDTVKEVSKLEQAKIDAEKARQAAEKQKKLEKEYEELIQKEEEDKNNKQS